jgi:mycothiol synthase
MVSIRVEQPPAPETVETARALEAAAARHDGHESLSSFVWRDLAAPSAETSGIVATEGARPVGYAHLAPSDTGADPHLVAGFVRDPMVSDDGVVPALLEALTAEARRRDAPVVLWVNGVDDDVDARVTAAGFERLSEQLQMRVPLPLAEQPKWPDGVTVRTFVPGSDDAAWLRVNNRAFATHPDQGGWVESTLKARMAEAWFDPDDFLLAIDGDGLAGFCWTKVHAPGTGDAGPVGEIYVIGVDPGRQGTGLGRALTVGGLRHLAADRHCPTGMLYVDGANPAALGLYRSLGFTTHHRDRAYRLGRAAGSTP